MFFLYFEEEVAEALFATDLDDFSTEENIASANISDAEEQRASLDDADDDDVEKCMGNASIDSVVPRRGALSATAA